MFNWSGADLIPYYFVQQEISAVFRSARINMFKTLTLLFISFLVCIVPANILVSFTALGIVSYYWMNSPLFHFLDCLYFSNCIFNPFIFGFKYKRFQNGIRNLRGKFFLKIQPTTVNDATGVSSRQ